VTTVEAIPYELRGDPAALVADRLAAFCDDLVANGYRHGSFTLHSRAYDLIREGLLSGVLAEGDLLSIRAVAAAFGTSSMPVREALGRLAVEGGLESLPSRAYRVPYITVDQFRELTLMRLRLEALACEHAAVRVKPHELVRIKEELDAMARALDASVVDYLAAHRRFHFSIYEVSGMPLLNKAIETLWLRMGPIMNTCMAAVDHQEKLRYHQRLFSMLERSDPVACGEAVQDDLNQTARCTSKYISDRQVAAMPT
jgi:GntR family transcriptional regulator, colanic acid and biofilm gene transcriptional regulator